MGLSRRMQLVVSCPSCSTSFRVEESLAGGKGSCPSCGGPCPLLGPRVAPFDVFVSYSTMDQPIADAACAVLEQRGIRCWIAPRNLTAGKEWSAGIIEGLERSRLMVLVFSTHANASPQVLREVERAVNRAMPIIPFRIEDVRPTGGMEYLISVPHWLDAFHPPLDEKLDRLAKTAVALLDATTPDTPVAPPRSIHTKIRRAVRAMLARDSRPRVLAGLGVFLLLCAGLFVIAAAALKEPTAGPDAIAVRAEADQLWEQVRGVRRDDGFGAGADALDVGVRAAQGAFEQKRFAEATAGYRAFAAAAKGLLAAAAARDVAAQASAATEAAWDDGVRAVVRAAEAAGDGDLTAAKARWEGAAAAFRQAGGSKRAESDRRAFEDEYGRYDVGWLETLAPDAWDTVRDAKAGAEAALGTGDYAAAAEAFATARELCQTASLPYRRYSAYWVGHALRTRYFLHRIRIERGSPYSEDSLYDQHCMAKVDDRAVRALGLAADVLERARRAPSDRAQLEELNQFLLADLGKTLGLRNRPEVIASASVGNNVATVVHILRHQRGRPRDVAADGLVNAVASARVAGWPREVVERLDRLRDAMRERPAPRYLRHADSRAIDLAQAEVQHWLALVVEFHSLINSPERAVRSFDGPAASLPPAGLAAWADSVGGGYEVDAEGVVVALDLAGCKVADADLIGLARASHLRSLVVQGNVTATGAAHLGRVKALEVLDLRDAQIGDTGLAHLAGLPALRDLSLSRAGVTDRGLLEVAKMISLERLALSRSAVTDSGLPALQPLARLRHLDLQSSQVKLTSPEVLQLPQSLEVLHLDSCVLGSSFSRTGVVNPGRLAALGDMPHLRELDLRHSWVADATLEGIERFSGLRRLYLDGNWLTDDGLIRVAGLGALEVLWLAGCNNLTDACLQHLSGLTHLTDLALDVPAITDMGAEALAGLAQLRSLGLARSRIGDRGIARLRTLTRLRELDVSHTRLTDAGLQSLEALPELTRVAMVGTKVTPAAVMEFSRRRPGVQVVMR